MATERWLVIFDKDGVLIDTEPGKTLSYWLALEELLGEVWSGWDKEKYLDWHTKALTGKSREKVTTQVLEQFPSAREIILSRQENLHEKLAGLGGKVAEELSSPKLPDKECQIFSALRLQKYNQIPLDERCIPIPKMIAWLKYLSRQDFIVALVTESEIGRTKTELEYVGIKPAIFICLACTDGVINGSDSQIAPGGSKQELYQAILKHTNCPPALAMAIEDTDKGRQAAIATGVICLQAFFPKT